MSREKRKEIIKKIEEKRGSKVITYVTSDRPGLGCPIQGDVVPILHKHILAAIDDHKTKLDLFIYSRGGQSDIPWTIDSMFREYSEQGSFSVLIPYRAHSAATVISLGADEIVMTRKAELGPIDITMASGPYNPTATGSNQSLPISVEDVTGYFSLLDRVGCEGPEEKMKGFQLLADRVHPLALGNVNRLLEETKLVALRLLSTRANPFSEEDNKEIVQRISSEIYSHQHTISRSEALRYIGLRQVAQSEKYEIDKELWDLYEQYKSLFDLDTPFKPEEELILNNLDEQKYENLRLACVESANGFDLCEHSMRVRKLRQIPAQVAINLNNLNLPPINLNGLAANLDQQQISIIVERTITSVAQQAINNAAQAAAKELAKSLPQAGFERFAYNYKWRRETTNV